MVLVLFCINFIVILTVIKVWSGVFNRAMGADAYIFNAKKRFLICAVLSLLLALLGI